MVKSGIYCIYNSGNGKRYIGRAMDLNSRRNGHFSLLRRSIHYNKHLQASFVKYGENLFEWIILEEVSEDILDIRERAWIEYYQSDNREFGYNKESGGSLLHRHSDDVRHKMSEAMKGNQNSLGHRHSEDSLRKMSEAKRGHFVSIETRNKISESEKGKTISLEHRHRISMANKGRHFSSETRRKMSESQRGNKKHLGYKHSEETRRKISEARKGRKLSAEHCMKMSKASKGIPWSKSRWDAQNRKRQEFKEAVGF